MSNETERLNAVNRFTTIDAGVKNDLNELVNLIAAICNMPVAVISLIDDNMQWFKAAIGVGNLTCNDRHLSFCQETITKDDILIVPDATRDARFANLPSVVNEPHVRFYAGVPLITFDGYAVGALCVIDVKPNELNELQTNALKVLGKQVLNLIELNWSMQSLMEQSINTYKQNKVIEDSEIKLKAVFDSSKDMHMLIGQKMEILAFNKAAFNYVKSHYDKEMRVGAHLLNIANQEFTDALTVNIRKALSGQNINVEWHIRPDTPTSCWFAVNFEAIYNSEGVIIGVAVNATDITIQKLHAEQIDQQNAALERIATIQSHELRRPVASLLGLMEVIKLEENQADDNYYSLMESTIKELDEKIRTIVSESESTIQKTKDTIPQLKGSC